MKIIFLLVDFKVKKIDMKAYIFTYFFWPCRVPTRPILSCTSYMGENWLHQQNVQFLTTNNFILRKFLKLLRIFLTLTSDFF